MLPYGNVLIYLHWVELIIYWVFRASWFPLAKMNVNFMKCEAGISTVGNVTKFNGGSIVGHKMRRMSYIKIKAGSRL